jgi:RNA polymerase sigma-70 factor (ECF subfamily)
MKMPQQEPDALLDRAAEGDQSVLADLFNRYRDRLKGMVAMRMDRRIAGRADPSDIVQEALLEAHQRLADYLRDRPMPFYVWLRHLTWEKLLQSHRRHLRSQRRSVKREHDLERSLLEHSTARLAERLVSRGPSPSAALDRKEQRERVVAALHELSDEDREVLLLRLVEQLSIRETAAVLGIAEGTVGSRQFRALERLRDAVDELP